MNKTYGEASLWLNEGAYTLKELQELIKELVELTAANKESMKEEEDHGPSRV